MSTDSLDIESKDISEPIFDYCQLTTNLGDKVDILSWVTELILYEDMFSPVLRGYVTVRDPIGFLDRVGISGLESFTLKFWSYLYQDPDKLNYIHRTFDILKITDIQDVNEYTKEYSLWFASPELLKNELIKISAGYTQVQNSKVVETIMSGSFEADEVSGIGPQGLEFPILQTQFSSIPAISPYLTTTTTQTWAKKEDEKDSVELFIEKTKYEEPVISFTYKKPFEIIDSLAAKSIRLSGGRYGTESRTRPANFVFFENKRGFQFVSIDSLLENKDINKTKFRFGSAEQNFMSADSRVVEYETIEKFQINNVFDILGNISRGMYASKLYSFDIASGKVSEFDYDLMEDFNKTETTEGSTTETKYPGLFLDSENKNTKLTNNFLQNRAFTVCSPYASLNIFTSEQSQRQNQTNVLSGPAEYLQSRMASFARLSNYQVLFELPGNSKHKVGDCVYIDLQTQIVTDTQENTEFDFSSVKSKYYSGYYLITSIKHILTKQHYKMVIEAAKDSHTAKFGK